MPPKVAHKVEDAIKSLHGKDTKNTRKRKLVKEVQRPQKILQEKRRFPLREIIFGLAVIVLLFGIYFVNRLPRAEIEISPTLDTITLQEKITADKSISEVDMKRRLIPLEFLEEVKETSQEFPATGITSNDGKAAGNIAIYNKLSPAAPLTLIPGTHFLSDSGKYFITLAKVTIPAMKGKTPGSVNVKVQAKEVGSDYNIGPSNFSVPKLSGTAYYYGIYGESKEAMTGGYTGKVKKVTKDDLDSAKDVLTEKLLKDAESSLKSKVSEDEILLEGAIINNVVNVSFNAKPETIADTFNTSAKVRVLALVFNKRDLEVFAEDKILSQLSDGKNLLENSLNIHYDAGSVDFVKGIEKINLQASARAYHIIDLNDVVDLSRRKSSDEIEKIINLQYGEKVSGVKVNFWPFWVKSAPKDVNRIKVKLNFE